MNKSTIIAGLIILLCLIGIFSGGFSSFIWLFVTVIIGSILLTLLIRFMISRQKTNKNYQKAVKQSRKLHPKKGTDTKKKKSSFKVIDGGKK
ncbi:hypothetical protein [Listeria costaricensis]|uniref:hypothetical protein n=1 Tax=Listeria costaricensis TaxID=2026604 RepID=UPI0019691F7C|nr:hypothetical protein [Listeria costaricensis]